MERLCPKKKAKGVDPFLKAIAAQPRARPKARPIGQLPEPPTATPEQFIIWQGHTGKPQLNGPNGKRVAKVIYEDGSEQLL